MLNSDPSSKNKVEENGITGRDVETIMLTVRIWARVKDRIVLQRRAPIPDYQGRLSGIKYRFKNV